MDRFDTVSSPNGILRQRSDKAKEGLSTREIHVPNLHEDKKDESSNADKNDLTLMEEILLLGLKEKTGSTPIWNISICVGLRACILIELGLKNRIELERVGRRRRRLLLRKVIVKDDTPLTDVLLDEALKHIRNADQPETIDSWLSYFNGDTYTWSISKLRYQLKNVRQRLAKNLVEKRILTTEKRSFFFFSLTSYPVVKTDAKNRIIARIRDALLYNWDGNPGMMDPRTLALIVVAHISDVLETALTSLEDDQYDLVAKRLNRIYELNFDEEATKPDSCEIMLAVFAALKQT